MLIPARSSQDFTCRRAGLRLDLYRPSMLLYEPFFHTIDPSGHAGLIGI